MSSKTGASEESTPRRPGVSSGHPPRSTGPEKGGGVLERLGIRRIGGAGKAGTAQPVCERTAKSCECVSCVEHLPRECHRSIAARAEAVEVFPGAVNIPSNRLMVCTACAERIRARYAARFIASRAEAVRSGEPVS
jgi:hypothetical protein